MFARTLVRMALVATALFASTTIYASDMYPDGPDARLTPGELCGTPNYRRYPEQIAYCERDVSTELKRYIIQMYDSKLGYQIGRMERGQFKIDHYIPLCAGGSNSMKNLWPQHKSVYEITDDMEHIGCQKLAAAKIRQKELLQLIVKGKNDLDQVPDIIDYLESL